MAAGLLSFLFFVLFIIVNLIWGAFTGFVAKEKGRGYFNWFVLGFFFWAIALLAVIGVPSLTAINRERAIAQNNNIVPVPPESANLEVGRKATLDTQQAQTGENAGLLHEAYLESKKRGSVYNNLDDLTKKLLIAVGSLLFMFLILIIVII